MDEIEKMLAKVAAERSQRPLAANAQDLFFAGHLTAEEHNQVIAAEQVASRLPDMSRMPTNPEELKKRDGDVFVITEGNKHIAPYLNDCIKNARGRIDSAIAFLVPNQIDHVIVRASRSANTQVASSNTEVVVEVQLECINVKKKTKVVVATPITINVGYLNNTDDDKTFWAFFDEQLVQQFAAVVMQLIQTIKKGDV